MVPDTESAAFQDAWNTTWGVMTAIGWAITWAVLIGLALLIFIGIVAAFVQFARLALRRGN